jgi:pyruvate-formate lyase-activating enzyme
MKATVESIDRDMVIVRLLSDRREAVLISTTLIPGLAEGDELEVEIHRATKYAPVVKPDASALLRELRKRL